MSNINLSIIIPVGERIHNIRDLYTKYKKAISEVEKSHEFIFVSEESKLAVNRQLLDLRMQLEPVRVIYVASGFGEAVAIKAAVAKAEGQQILTLPSYEQVNSKAIQKILAASDKADILIGKRWPRRDGVINKTQCAVYNGALKLMTGMSISDVGCSVRLFKKSIFDEIDIYGDLHRFIPLLARQQGFSVKEVEVEQGESDRHRRLYPLGIYIRRSLDLLTVVFLTKFTKKPLRFFGLIGSFCLGVGGLGIIYMVMERLLFSIAMADRPAILLFSVFAVLGVHLIAIGLVGETLIFTHAKDFKEYKVKEIIN